MINLILLAFGLCACFRGNEFSMKSNPQASEQTSTLSHDTISCSMVLLNETPLLSPKDRVQSSLGKPDTVLLREDVIDEPSIEYEVLVYGQSELLFESDKLTEVSLQDSRIGVTKNKLKVGDSITRLSVIYPLSFNNFEDKANKEFIVYFQDCEESENPEILEGYVTFKYDESQIIEKIIIRFLQ